MKNIVFCIYVLLLLQWVAVQAQPGFEILRDVKKIEIPFEYKNNLIVVNVTFNRIFPLKFIVDTGAEHTILSRKEITDLLGTPYHREFKILGSDMRTEVTAYLVQGMHLKISDMVIPYHSMLVLKEDYLRLDEMSGMELHGILGADVFRGLVVKFDFQRKVITLMKNKFFNDPGRSYVQIPIDIQRNKPYLDTQISILRDTSIPVRLLLDTGAMLSLMLNTETHPLLKLPPNTIKGTVGAGLGGLIEGYIGRVAKVQLGEVQCMEVVTNFQEPTEWMDTMLLRTRNGVIGNEILSRFDVIIDYTSEKLYLRPNRKFKHTFEYDKSGLIVVATDVRLNKYVVHSVIPGSPAALAGLMPGDEIRKINFSASTFLSLSSIKRILSGREGKKINMVVKRNDAKIKTQFRLKKLI